MLTQMASAEGQSTLAMLVDLVEMVQQGITPTFETHHIFRAGRLQTVALADAEDLCWTSRLPA